MGERGRINRHESQTGTWKTNLRYSGNWGHRNLQRENNREAQGEKTGLTPPQVTRREDEASHLLRSQSRVAHTGTGVQLGHPIAQNPERAWAQAAVTH